MNARGSSRTSLALKLAGAVTVLSVSKVLFRDGKGMAATDRVGASRETVRDAMHAKHTDLLTYGIGYILALTLTCAAFALVHWQWVSGQAALGAVFGLALLQAVVHFRCFLHVDLKRSARDDLQLILFSTLIIALMVGGTLVVLFNLRMRMM